MKTGSLVPDNETGFKAIFTHATVGIIIVDHAGLVTQANPFACRMLGYEEGELVGQDVSILIPEDLRDDHKVHIQGYFRSPVNRPMGQGLELMAVKRNGDRLYVEISLCSYWLNEERLGVAFITDVTRQRLEAQRLRNYREGLELLVAERTRELNEALEREKQLGYAKSQFVSFASHEFRTPLSIILSSILLISKYNERLASENIDKHTSRIKAAVTSLTQLLNDFLSLDKLEQGVVSVNRESFHLGNLITEVNEELENYLKLGQAIVHAHMGSAAVFTDRNILRNILLNLLSNASKYSEEQKCIVVNTTLENDVLCMEVIDWGIGIPEKDLGQLFSLFYRASNVGTIKGTGLGLNIVSKYVALLGGDIAVSSIQNSGTTFRVRVPVEQGHSTS